MAERVDRDWISGELERARLELRELVSHADSAELARKTQGTRWTNEQMLFHMVLGFLIVRTLVSPVRVFAMLPIGVSGAFARLLDAGRTPFHAINYAGSVAGALFYRGPRLVRRMDRVVTKLQGRLERTPEIALGRGTRFPISWDPFFRDFMTLADVFAYPVRHFDFHRRQLTLSDPPAPG